MSHQDFLDICSKGKLGVAKQMLERMPELRNKKFKGTTLIEEAFENACFEGHLDLAQWLLSVKPDIRISTKEEWLFKIVCMKCYFHVAQWLLSVEPNINISEGNNYLFYDACTRNQLDVVQWLYSVKPDMDITLGNHDSFKNACLMNNIAVAQWLQSLKPHLYEIIYHSPTFIRTYKIRIQEEANWQKRKYAVWMASDNAPDKKNLIYKLPTDISRMMITYI